MTEDEFIKQKIAGFSWYQTIQFKEGIKSVGCEWCGDPAWENIRKLLPDSLEGKRVLDLGSNAGIFCVRSALMGAECVGIESDEWKKDTDYLKQAEFVKDYFEKDKKRSLPIRYLEGRIEDIIEQDLGHFDYCYGIACLYYLKEPEKVMKRLTDISDNIIMRLRDINQIELFTGLAEKNGFFLKGCMREEWWTKLGRVTDDFYLYHYGR